jgi:hypothetical protein
MVPPLLAHRPAYPTNRFAGATTDILFSFARPPSPAGRPSALRRHPSGSWGLLRLPTAPSPETPAFAGVTETVPALAMLDSALLSSPRSLFDSVNRRQPQLARANASPIPDFRHSWLAHVAWRASSNQHDSVNFDHSEYPQVVTAMIHICCRKVAPRLRFIRNHSIRRNRCCNAAPSVIPCLNGGRRGVKVGVNHPGASSAGKGAEWGGSAGA